MRYFILCFIFFFQVSLFAEQDYCEIPQDPGEPFVTHPDAIAEDHEGWNRYIEGYKPVIYLHSDENYYPILAEEFFLHPETTLLDQNGATLIPPGEMTMEEIYDENNTGNRKTGYYFEVPHCVRWGSNPELNTNEDGDLTSPIYAMAYEGKRDGVPKIYVHYVFFYGHNGAYKIAPLGIDLADAGEHKTDVEHMTIEIDKETKKLERLFLAAHGEEGVWMDANHKHLKYEDGTHPVVYSAKGSHATYPREGVYVRIFGYVNDNTEKSVRWDPHVTRFYLESDERFDPSTMGWIYHRGDYTYDHVASVALKDWLGDVSNETGRDYEDVLFCKSGDTLCLWYKSPQAFPP